MFKTGYKQKLFKIW